MAGPIAPTYKSGYQGTVEVDGVTYPVQGWKSSGDPGLWDATNTTTGGWFKQERGIRKITFTFTVLCKVTNGVPTFVEGNAYAAEFTIDGAIGYAGNVMVSKFDTNPDLKGGVTFDVTADSDGPMTGLSTIGGS